MVGLYSRASEIPRNIRAEYDARGVASPPSINLKGNSAAHRPRRSRVSGIGSEKEQGPEKRIVGHETNEGIEPGTSRVP